MPQLVITAVGPDRPGLVGELTGALFNAGGNLADSRMVNLRGQFALLMLVEGSEGVLEAVRAPMGAAAAKLGLALSFGGKAEPARGQAGVPYKLKTYSMDQPGIVHRISDLLQRHGVNIEDLQTRQESGPFMGAPLFTLEARLTVPPTLSLKTLRLNLQGVCDALNCDLDLEPA